MANIFRTKSIDQLIRESTGEGEGKASLKKALGSFELTMLGVGAVIGTGIFVLTGVAAAKYSGPALVISFIISGLACIFAGLCYAEFAAMVPVAGSAYTYGYAALGEIWAWIIGWDLILEYTVANAAVAIGWSGYIVSLLNSAGIHLPAFLINAPGVQGGMINLPAILIVFLISWLLILGVKESARLNNIIVGIKIAVVLLFILIGVFHINPANWQPFMPYGWSGVFQGAAIIFFAYIGFDAVSTAAEEVKNPQKDLPRGIIGSLVICTALYIIVSAILTGMVPYLKFMDTSAPVAYALAQVGINWGSALVSVGAVSGITSVLLVMLFGQTRVFFAMSRDGLLPKVFGEVHPVRGTPGKSTILVGIVTAILAGFTPISAVAELTNIGTLAAFVIVSAAVIFLRVKRPELKRPFKVPGVPITPLLSILFCSYLILVLPRVTHIRFIVWLALGFVVYFIYGYWHSTMNRPQKAS
ncbi:MAG: amino acid permease [Clostridia bacterium]|nr:amino acid permease [Clostridia bacterium]